MKLKNKKSNRNFRRNKRNSLLISKVLFKIILPKGLSEREQAVRIGKFSFSYSSWSYQLPLIWLETFTCCGPCLRRTPLGPLWLFTAWSLRISFLMLLWSITKLRTGELRSKRGCKSLQEWIRSLGSRWHLQSSFICSWWMLFSYWFPRFWLLYSFSFTSWPVEKLISQGCWTQLTLFMRTCLRWKGLMSMDLEGLGL